MVIDMENKTWEQRKNAGRLAFDIVAVSALVAALIVVKLFG
jgi:hypothetical protein